MSGAEPHSPGEIPRFASERMKVRTHGRFPLVSVVAPVYNEAATLREFTRRLVSVCRSLESAAHFEFILVDDGSTDDSLNVAKMLIAEEPRLRVIELRRNFGQTAALQAGLAAARGNVIISMDSDLQHFPEDIPLFLDAIEEGYDLVCGWRLRSGRWHCQALAVARGKRDPQARRRPADP